MKERYYYALEHYIPLAKGALSVLRSAADAE